MFDKNSFIRLIYSVLVAMTITMIVLAITTQYSVVVFIILKGMIAGAVIWFLGELLFPICEKIYPRSIIPSYLLLMLLILIGTSVFGHILGVKSIPLIIKMCIAAELFGVGITILYRRIYIKKLNENLERNKNLLE